MLFRVITIRLKERAVFLAPLSAYSNYPYRVVATQNGADYTVTEMVNVNGLYYHFTRTFNPRTGVLIYTDELENNAGIQLFGNDPRFFKKATNIVNERLSFKFISLNAGCPKNAITTTGAGADLLNNISTLKAIIESTINCTNLPVSLKLRLGYNSINIFDVLKAIEEYDLSWLTVHLRLASESYKTPVKKELLNEVIRHSPFPIIANGDIRSLNDIETYFDNGAYGVAIGRAAIGNPFIFSRNNEPTISDRITVFKQFIKLVERQKSKSKNGLALRFTKDFTTKLFRDLPNSKKTRMKIRAVKTLNELEKLILVELYD